MFKIITLIFLIILNTSPIIATSTLSPTSQIPTFKSIIDEIEDLPSLQDRVDYYAQLSFEKYKKFLIPFLNNEEIWWKNKPNLQIENANDFSENKTIGIQEPINIIRDGNKALFQRIDHKEQNNIIYHLSDLHGGLDIFYAFLKETKFIERLISEENIYLIVTGDIVDRGPDSLPLFTALLVLKKRFPKNIILTRGNHETINMNLRYGFFKELFSRYKDKSFEMLEIFETIYYELPLYAMISTHTDLNLLFIHALPPLEDYKTVTNLSEWIKGNIKETETNSSQVCWNRLLYDSYKVQEEMQDDESDQEEMQDDQTDQEEMQDDETYFMTAKRAEMILDETGIQYLFRGHDHRSETNKSERIYTTSSAYDPYGEHPPSYLEIDLDNQKKYYPIIYEKKVKDCYIKVGDIINTKETINIKFNGEHLSLTGLKIKLFLLKNLNPKKTKQKIINLINDINHYIQYLYYAMNVIDNSYLPANQIVLLSIKAQLFNLYCDNGLSQPIGEDRILSTTQYLNLLFPVGILENEIVFSSILNIEKPINSSEDSLENLRALDIDELGYILNNIKELKTIIFGEKKRDLKQKLRNSIEIIKKILSEKNVWEKTDESEEENEWEETDGSEEQNQDEEEEEESSESEEEDQQPIQPLAIELNALREEDNQRIQTVEVVGPGKGLSCCSTRPEDNEEKRDKCIISNPSVRYYELDERHNLIEQIGLNTKPLNLPELSSKHPIEIEYSPFATYHIAWKREDKAVIYIHRERLDDIIKINEEIEENAYLYINKILKEENYEIDKTEGSNIPIPIMINGILNQKRLLIEMESEVAALNGYSREEIATLHKVREKLLQREALRLKGIFKERIIKSAKIELELYKKLLGHLNPGATLILNTSIDYTSCLKKSISNDISETIAIYKRLQFEA